MAASEGLDCAPLTSEESIRSPHPTTNKSEADAAKQNAKRFRRMEAPYHQENVECSKLRISVAIQILIRLAQSHA
jgi:hypothetical protein